MLIRSNVPYDAPVSATTNHKENRSGMKCIEFQLFSNLITKLSHGTVVLLFYSIYVRSSNRPLQYIDELLDVTPAQILSLNYRIILSLQRQAGGFLLFQVHIYICICCLRVRSTFDLRPSSIHGGPAHSIHVSSERMVHFS